MLLSLAPADGWAQKASNVDCNKCVDTGDIAKKAIDKKKLAKGAVDSSRIADGGVKSQDIADSAVGESKLAAGSVTSGKIADSAVDGSKLAASAVSSDKIADGGVATQDLADGAVDGSKLAADAVDSDKIANGGVATQDLAASSVNGSKLAAGAVGGDKIADGAVTAAKLAPGAVFEHIIVVPADPLDTIGNCDALRDALTGITDNDADNRYLVHLEPGTFDCGFTTLQMKDYVALQGSGRDFTLITGTVSGNSGIITAADNTELSRLALENINATTFASTIGLNIDSVSVRVTDVAVSAQNSTTVTAIRVLRATAVLTNVTAEASGVTVVTGNTTGIQIATGSSAELVNVTARAADGAGADDCGLQTNIGPSGTPLVVRNSVFSGPDAACILNPLDEANFVSTQLDGGTSLSSLGTLACVGSYDENYLALMPDCS